jgi:BASS family bile acid:Na+ symporter
MNALEIIKLVLKISIFLTALGFGLQALPRDVFYMFRHPGKLLRAFLAMNVIMPAFAIVVALNFELSPLIKVALIAISLSPLPPIFPRKTKDSGEGGSYTIGLMVAACLLALVMIPLTLIVLEKLLHRPVEISMPAILMAVVTTVFAPLLLGIAIRYLAPALAEKTESWVARIAQILLILAVLPIIFKMFPAIISLAGNGTILVLVAFVVVGLLVGHFLGGPSAENRSVLALATAARHPAIALSLASANLPDHKLLPAAILLYLLINAIVIFPYQKWIAKRPQPAGNPT